MVTYDKKIFEKPYSSKGNNFKNNTLSAMEIYAERMFKLSTTYTSLTYYDNNFNAKGVQELRVLNSSVNEDIRNLIVLKKNNKVQKGYYTLIELEGNRKPYLIISRTSYETNAFNYTSIPCNKEIYFKHRNGSTIKIPVVLIRGSLANVNMLGKISSKVIKGHTEIIDKLLLITPTNQYTTTLEVNTTINLNGSTFLIQGVDEVIENEVMQFTVKLTAERKSDNNGMIIDNNQDIEGIDY